MADLVLIFGSIFLVSVFSIAGIVLLSLNEKILRKILLYLVSFSAGALLGDAFIHILPEAVGNMGFGIEVSLLILLGFAMFFFIEKVIKWHHCHGIPEGKCEHTFTYMNLIGDAVHNFIDGMIIAGSYLVNVPLGIATTIAVLFHELPQEIGDFGVLIHGGFSKKKAIALNFAVALTAFLGGIVAIVASSVITGFEMYLLPFTAGGFIYIAASDLIPELHKDTNLRNGILLTFSFILGIAAMAALLLVEI
ncbi:MAG: ZIP family metal transporter [Candidatus Diapherotrites archaeon]